VIAGLFKYAQDQPRDDRGRWTAGSGRGVGSESANPNLSGIGTLSDDASKITHDQRMAQANYKDTSDQMGKDLDSMQPSVHEVAPVKGKLTSDNLKIINANARTVLGAYSSYLAGDTALRGSDYLNHMKGILSDPSLKDLDADVVNRMMTNSVHKLLFQEMESNRQQFTDHGIRHIVGDVIRQDELFMAETNGKGTAMERLMGAFINVNHDVGYTVPLVRAGGQRAIDVSHDHEAMSAKIFEDQRSIWNAGRLFSSDQYDRMKEAVATHGQSVLDKSDWLKSSVRLADDLALFADDKLPSMFRYVRDGKQILADMGRAAADYDAARKAGQLKAQESAEKKFEAIRKVLHKKIEKEPKLSYALKRDLKAATREITFLTPKFTLGVLAGSIVKIAREQDKVNIDIQHNSWDTYLQKYFDMGQKQTKKLLEHYGHTDFTKNSYELGDTGIIINVLHDDPSQKSIEKYAPDQPRDSRGRWSAGSGSGSGESSIRTTGTSDACLGIIGIKREDLPKMFNIDGADEVSVYSTGSNLNCSANYKTNRMADITLSFNRAMDTCHIDLMELPVGMEGKEIGKNFLTNLEGVLAKNGYKTISLLADLDIGRYAWARMGFDYSRVEDVKLARAAFFRFCEDRKIPNDDAVKLMSTVKSAKDMSDLNFGGFKTARDWKVRNDEVPSDMPMKLGKAFMLDQSPGTAHGSWHAEKTITATAKEKLFTGKSVLGGTWKMGVVISKEEMRGAGDGWFWKEFMGDGEITEKLLSIEVELKYSKDQPRDDHGRWATSGGGLTIAEHIRTDKIRLTPKQSAPPEEVGKYLDDRHKRAYGKSDFTNPEDLQKAIDHTAKEVQTQLSQTPAAKDWYTKDVAASFEKIYTKFPELRDDEKKRNFFAAMLAVSSPQQDPIQNIRVALDAYKGYRDSGVIPEINPNALDSNHDNWSGMYTRIGFPFINKMRKECGGEKEVVDWLNNPAIGGRDINKMREKCGLGPADGVRLDGVYSGVRIFGDKVDDFYENITARGKGATLDMWMTRAFNRQFGRIISHEGKTSGKLRTTPETVPQREAMKKWVDEVAKKTIVNGVALEPSQAQAVIWYFEQHLYHQLGARRSVPKSFSEGVDRWLNPKPVREPKRRNRNVDTVSKERRGNGSGGLFVGGGDVVGSVSHAMQGPSFGHRSRGAETVAGAEAGTGTAIKYSEDQLRDDYGRWSTGSSIHRTEPQNESEKSILDQLSSMDSMTKIRPGYVYKHMYDIVLKEGSFYNPAPKPADVRQGQPKQCFTNAAMLAFERPDLTYVEGYAIAWGSIPLAQGHAWCVDRKGNVVDNTWSNITGRDGVAGTAYFGIPFSTEFVRKTILAKGKDSVLMPSDIKRSKYDPYKNGFPDGAIKRNLKPEGRKVYIFDRSKIAHHVMLCKYSADQPRDDHGRWSAGSGSGAGSFSATAPSILVTGYNDQVKGFTNLTQKDLEEIFHVEGLHGSIPVLKGYENQLTCFWNDAEDHPVGKVEVHYDYSKRFAHVSLMEMQKNVMGKAVGSTVMTNLEKKLKEKGYKTVELFADLTVGMYTWAKMGFDYVAPTVSARERALKKYTKRFVQYVKDRAPLDSYARARALKEIEKVKHASDMAKLDVGVIKTASAWGIDNEDVPRSMKMHLGKAFMLDENRGHGTWDAVKSLSGSISDYRPSTGVSMTSPRKKAVTPAVEMGAVIADADKVPVGGSDYWFWEDMLKEEEGNARVKEIEGLLKEDK
jgi:hypothetical protein